MYFNNIKSKTTLILVVVIAVILALYIYSKLKGESIHHEYFDTEDTEKVLVLYYVPWCKFCKNLMPEWEELERKLSSDPKIKVKRINGDNLSSEEKSKAKINSYPTIKLENKNGSIHEYNGERNAQSLEAFINSK